MPQEASAGFKTSATGFEVLPTGIESTDFATHSLLLERPSPTRTLTSELVNYQGHPPFTAPFFPDVPW